MKYVAIPLVLVALPALARSPISTGAALNAHAGLGAVIGDDPTTLHTNPASLETPGGARFAGYAELTPTFVKHEYTHPRHEAFALTVVAPLVAAGGAVKVGPADLGVVAMPTGAGSKLVVEGLPVDVTPTDSALSSVATETTGYDLAAGGGVALGRRVRLGLSLLQTYRENAVEIDVEGSEKQLLDAKMKAFTHRLVAGLRAEIGRVGIGASVTTPARRKFEGDAAMPALGLTERYDVDGIEYQPLVVSLGSSVSLGRFGVNAEYSYEGHAAGASEARTGMNPLDARETALSDVHAVSVSGDMKVATKWSLSAGVSHSTAAIGEGLFSERGGAEDKGISGMRFGLFEGLARTQAGAGARYAAGKIAYGLSGHVIHGTATVGEDRPGQGEYSLFMAGVGASVSVGL